MSLRFHFELFVGRVAELESLGVFADESPENLMEYRIYYDIQQVAYPGWWVFAVGLVLISGHGNDSGPNSPLL
jgi:hypothetical protein